MRFRACAYTPKSCECPLPEKRERWEVEQCDCCQHIVYSGRWSRKAYCDGGKKCILTFFPQRLHYQWEMMWRCVTVVGMGSLDISIEKFKFFISDILEIDRDRWQELYDVFMEMLGLYQKYGKADTAHIEHKDILLIKELALDGTE